MKVLTTVRLDPEVHAMAKTRQINVSAMCNDFLRSYLFSDEQQDIKEMRQHLETDLQQHKRIIAQINAHLAQLKSAEKLQEEEERRDELKHKETVFDALKKSGRLGDLL